MSETQDLFNLEENNLLGGNHTSSDDDDDDDMSDLSGGFGPSDLIPTELLSAGCCVFYCVTYIICSIMIWIIHKKSYCK